MLMCDVFTMVLLSLLCFYAALAHVSCCADATLDFHSASLVSISWVCNAYGEDTGSSVYDTSVSSKLVVSEVVVDRSATLTVGLGVGLCDKYILQS